MTDFMVYDELMPRIQSLLAATDTTLGKDKTTSNPHSLFKRKGKWYNHDYCDACGEKGKLLCCDICPASFHLLCHDPPLVEARVPSGPWTCSACNILDNEDLQNKSYRTESVSNIEKSHILVAQKKDVSVDSSKLEVNETDSCSRLRRKSNSLTSVGLNSAKTTRSNTKNCDNISSGSIDQNFEGDNYCYFNFNSNSIREFPSFEQKYGKLLEEKIMKMRELNLISRSAQMKSETRMNKVGAKSNDDEMIDSNITCKKVKRTNSNCDQICESTSGLNVECINYKKFRCHDFKIKLPNCDKFLDTTPDLPEMNENHLTSFCESSNNDITKLFHVIVSESKKLNPKQFVLPSEYTDNINAELLHSGKDPDSIPCDWDSNDLLKKPLRKCYFCKGTCLSSQMISCDFCPAHFHLNCLDPPLCNIPETKWMCPLHPHHILKRVMDNPCSISELTSWWRDFSASFDPNDVISNFISRRGRRRQNREPCINTSIKIPEIVKYHYSHPVNHIPSLESIINQKSDNFFEKPAFPAHTLISKSNNSSGSCQRDHTANSQHSLQKNVKSHCEGDKDNSLIEIVDDDGQNAFRNKSVEMVRSNKENFSTWDRKNNRFESRGIYDYDSFADTESLNTVKAEKSSWEKIEEILAHDIDTNFIKNGMYPPTLDSSLKSLLIQAKLNSIIGDLPPSFLPGSLPYPYTPPFWKNSFKSEKLPAKVCAVLCPLSHRAPLVLMGDNILCIGSDFSNDVCLLNYGHCNFISAEHAVIFHDKVNNTFELLNYSEFCTVVDGISYTCDISHPARSAQADTYLSTETDSSSGKSLNENSLCDSSIVIENHPETTKKNASFSALRSKSKKASGFESRNVLKKCMSDIDKLVTKSKKEMASIAEEDLNEIAKAIKASSDMNGVRKESTDKQKPVKKMELSVLLKQLDTELLNDHLEVDSSTKSSSDNNSSVGPKSTCANIVCNNPVKLDEQKFVSTSAVSVPPTEIKSEPTVSRNDTTLLRRSRRKIKRSVLATHYHETRKEDQKLNWKMLSGESDEEIQIIGKKPLTVTNVEKKTMEKEGNKFSCNRFYIPEAKDKCHCQLMDLLIPDGNDPSWENSALLRHGSYIRFGCIEFVFSIINQAFDVGNSSHQLQNSTAPSSESEKHKSLLSQQGRENEEISRSGNLSPFNVFRNQNRPPSSKPGFFNSDSSINVTIPTSSRSVSPSSLHGLIEVDNCSGLVEVNHENYDSSLQKQETNIDDSF